MKTESLNSLTNRIIGKKGSVQREIFENELRLDLLGEAIREARLRRKLTQAELGALIGVQKAQISKIENNTTSARFDTLMKVFNALDASVYFRLELLPNHA
ncbi:MAG: helix-turn-helix domain-containing protein [Flavobacteriales bacterium]